MSRAPHPSSAAIIDLYRRHADAWVRMRHGAIPPFEQPWFERFHALLPPSPAVLDIGCGSGQPVAEWLIAHGAIVTGVDASGPLLAHARARHPAPHQWIEADMRGLDLGDVFDGVLAWHSAFHLTQDDQRAMFDVYRRHVRPGGALMFTCSDEDGEAIGVWEGEPLYHASLDAAEYRRLLDEAGFDVVTHLLEPPVRGSPTAWLARRRA